MMDGKKFGFFIIKREAFIAERKDDIRNVYEFDRKVRPCECRCWEKEATGTSSEPNIGKPERSEQ